LLLGIIWCLIKVFSSGDKLENGGEFGDPVSVTVEHQNIDWQERLDNLSFAYGRPDVTAQIKAVPEDFKVTEIMQVAPLGEGEHYWLDISKVGLNTDAVAKALARFANVAYRDVGYSGLKDFFAETRQWFSVWLPKGDEPDWSAFLMDNTQIHTVQKHTRKLKRGTHQGNRFEIALRNLDGDVAGLAQRIEQVKQRGVPNYFGAQRFGRQADNMNQANAMLLQGKRIKNRSTRSILLSAARSWLFNAVVSERVKEASWQHFYDYEPANLSGTNSIFITDGDAHDDERLKANDIHPTAPMWGEGGVQMMERSKELGKWELNILADYQDLCKGIENARVRYQRRALRATVPDLSWTFKECSEDSVNKQDLYLNFTLPRGQFGTSVLRELVAAA